MTDDLRKRAEELAGDQTTDDMMACSPEAMCQALHELRVHQIELEIQNEELRRAQAELETSRARYFDLYDLAPVGYCTVSERGLILEANLTAAKLLGVPRGELSKKPLTRFIHEDDQDTYYLHRKQLFASRSSESSELRLVRGDGTAFWANFSTSLVTTADGEAVCHIAISDINERKKDEQFRENVERIVRHDIKGPLVSLFSLMQISQLGIVDQIPKDAIPDIMHGVQRIIRIIDATEPLLQMEKGTYEPRKKSFSLRHVLDSVISSLTMLTNQRKAEILLHFPAASPAQGEMMLCGEEFLIEDMLVNLVKNAVEASPVGGRIDIDCHEEHAALCLAIHNDGAVPEPVRARFFEKGSTAGKPLGTGLGTYSALLIAKAHHGNIAFTTSEAKGTTVTVTLPDCTRA